MGLESAGKRGVFLYSDHEGKIKVLSADINDNLSQLRGDFGSSMDFLIREINICGFEGALVLCDGLTNSTNLSQMISEPILHAKPKFKSPEETFDYLRDSVVGSVEQQQVYNYKDLEYFVMSGFAVLLLDGVNRGLAMGIQGFAKRGIDEPSTEAMSKGSREGFIENLTDNVALMRRRIKSTKLKFDLMKIGKYSDTRVAVCYLDGVVDPDMLAEVKRRLNEIDMDTILDFGYLQPYLDEHGPSMFTAVGNTERPDTLCAKVMEGHIGVMMDGTPFALIVPYLFTEHFQSFDDYDNRPFYASFIRLLKYFSFLVSIFLPGTYVAIATFHPELLPPTLLYDVAASEARTPFPLMLEALIIHIMYEIMREAGLRLPKTIGHAVSIIGALVIGEATVNAGLIGAPMLIVVALTAISSYVVYSLYEPVAILRLILIFVGGMTGLYGIMISAALLLTNAVSMNPYGIPYSAPISPFFPAGMRDVFLRWGMKTLKKTPFKIKDYLVNSKGGRHASKKK